MQNMQGTKKVVLGTLLMCMAIISIGPVVAMVGNQNGELDREQLRDGSCCDCVNSVADKQQTMLQTQTREQLRDGSCCDCVCNL